MSDPDPIERLAADPLSDSNDDSREPIEVLASEFLDQRRTGKAVSIDDFVKMHPEMESEIRELFPAMMAMENIRDHESSVSGSTPSFSSIAIPERLGDLRIIRQIGRGGMGVVYEAEQESLGRRVAVKVLPQLGMDEQRSIQRFHREASAAAKLHHTNIVPVLGVGEHEGHHYYVMQLIRGVGLDEIILRYPRRNSTDRPTEEKASDSKPLSEPETNEIATKEHEGSTNVEERHSSLGVIDREVPRTEVIEGGNQLADLGEYQDLSDESLVKTAPLSNSRTFANDSFRQDDRLDLTDRVMSALEKHGGASLSVNYPVRVSGHLWNIVAKTGLQAAEALAYAHEMNTLHRDIKPANLIVDEHGIVWVTDFGLAKVLDDSNQSQTGDLVGTLRYMPPERFDGHSDHRSDIHALGLTLFEMVAGRPAFDQTDRAQLIREISQGEPPSLRRLNPAVPRDLETIVNRCIERDPKRRYQTAVELEDDLRRFLDDMPIRARKINALERSWRWCRRNPMLATLTTTTALSLLMVMSLLIAGFFRSNSLLAREQRQRKLADETNKVAVETLDSLYNEFSPRRVQMLSSRSLIDADGSEVQVDLPPVISDESARMLERFLPLYDRLADLDQGQNDKYQLKSIEANRRIGDIRHQLGQYALALEAYQVAEQKLNALVGDQPDDLTLRLRQAAVQNEMGFTTRSLQEFGKWRDYHQTALSLLKQIEDQLGESESRLQQQLSYERARSYYLLGKVSVPVVASNPLWLFREFGASRFPRNESRRRPDSSRREKGDQRPNEKSEGGDLRRPPGDRSPENRAPNGRAPNGNVPNGNVPNGNVPNGNVPSGRASDDRDAEQRPRPRDQQGNAEGQSGSIGPLQAQIPSKQVDLVVGYTGPKYATLQLTSSTGDLAFAATSLGGVQSELLEANQVTFTSLTSMEPKSVSGGPPYSPLPSRSRELNPELEAQQGPPQQERRRPPRNRGGGRSQGMLGENLKWMNLAVAEAEALNNAYPENVEYEFFLASCYRERAIIGDDESQRSDLNRATAILENLVEGYPEVPDYRFELSRTLALESSPLYSTSSAEQGSSLDEAIGHSMRLSRQHPNVLAYADFLGLLYIRQAQQYVLSGGKERVEDLLWLAAEQYMLLMDRAPEVWFYQFAFENAILNWLAVVQPRVEFEIQDADSSLELAVGEAGEQDPNSREPLKSVDLREDISRLNLVREVVDGYEAGALTWRVKSEILQSLVWAYQKSGQAELAASYQLELEQASEQLEDWNWERTRTRFGRPSRRRDGEE